MTVSSPGGCWNKQKRPDGLHPPAAAPSTLERDQGDLGPRECLTRPEDRDGVGEQTGHDGDQEHNCRS